MSGAGRKGAYRKGVMEEVMNGLPEPEEGEVVARVRAPRGGNVLEVTCGDGSEGLAILPTRFRKLVWVKRGDYLIVSGATSDIEVGQDGSVGAVRYRVSHILYKDQVRHLKNAGLWPAIFEETPEAQAAEDTGGPGGASSGGGDEVVAATDIPPSPPSKDQTGVPPPASVVEMSRLDMGKEYPQNPEEGSESEEDSEDDESDLVANTNRRGHVQVEDSSSDEADGE